LGSESINSFYSDPESLRLW